MQRRKTIEVPSMQEIDALYKAGKIDEMRAINERLAKTANQRRVQLYESGIKTSSARSRMELFTQQVLPEHGFNTGGVFSRSKKLDPELLKKQLEEEIIFLKSPSSTVSGEKRRRAEASFDTLTHGKKPYLDIPEEIQIPADWEGSSNDYFKEMFLGFLEEDAWKDIKKYLYSPDTNVLAEAGEAISRGASLRDLKQAYKKYLSNQVSIYEMWESWTSV